MDLANGSGHRPELFHWPLFLRLDFPERAGALHDFLVSLRGTASICHFNYVFTGEEIGRALIGVVFETEAHREEFRAWLPSSGARYREVEADAVEQIG